MWKYLFRTMLGLMCGILLPLSTQAYDDGIYSGLVDENGIGVITVIFGGNDTFSGVEMTLKAENQSGTYRRGNNIAGDSTIYNGVENNNRRGGSGDVYDNGFTPNPSDENKITRRGPCDTGYHVPSNGERNALTIAWCNLDTGCNARYSDTQVGGVSGDLLKLTTWTESNKLIYISGSGLGKTFKTAFNMTDTFWSSSLKNTNMALRLFVGDDRINPDGVLPRSLSIPVRCIKNSIVKPTQTFTITFNASVTTLRDEDDNNPESNTITYTPSDDITLYTNYIDGYTFNGWDVDVENSSGTWLNITDTITDMHIGSGYTGNVALNYNSTPQNYQLYIDDSDCDISANTFTVIYGKALNAEGTTLAGQNSLPIPTKTGYTFKGYSKEEGSTTLLLKLKSGKVSPNIVFNDGNFEIDHDNKTSTIYPVFNVKPITIVLHDPVGGNSNIPNNTYGSTVILPDPESDVYIFDGWYSAESGGNLLGEGGNEYTINTDTTPIHMYARWSCPPGSTMDEGGNCEDVETTLQYKLYIDDSECSVSPNELDVIYGKVLNATGTTLQGQDSLPIPTKDGYIFKGYSKEPNSTGLILKYKGGKIATSIHFNESNFVVDHDSRTATIYPVFELIRYIYNPDANITYTDTNGKDFTGIGTITVTDGTTSITILDRNLGATAAGVGCEDPDWGTACAEGDATYGYHFQRGNNYGFKSTGEVQSGTDKAEWNSAYANKGYYGATYIKSDWNPYGGDWWEDSTNNSANHYNLWGGSLTETTDGAGNTIDIWDADYLNGNDWKVNPDTVKNRQGPCPENFHVPSAGELAKLTKMFGLDNEWSNYEEVSSAMHSQLKIPFAGLRNYDDALAYSLGGGANLWSSGPNSASSPTSRGFSLGVDGDLAMDDNGRASAYSVRCFYDFYQPFTQSFTLTFDVSDDNGDTDAETGAVTSGRVVALNTGDFVATKDGWTHLGWNTDVSATGALETITVTGNTTVYAIFSKDLTVNYATGTGVSTIQKESDSCSIYNTGTSCTITTPSIAEDEGYENGVWKKGETTVNPGDDITLTSDGDTYTATATAKEFTITFVDSNQQYENVVYSGAYNSAVNTQYPSWTREGYSISWNKAIPATMPLNGDTITANWTENKKPSGGSSGGGGRNKTSSDEKDVISNDSEKSSEQLAGSQVDSSEQTPQNDNTASSGANAKDPLSVTPIDSSAEASEGQQFTDEFQQAYKFAHENGITTMPTIQKADMNGKLTRIAMAKMLSQYAINVLGQKPANIVVPKFNDVTEKMDSDYDNGVTLAYQLGIMGQNMPNNKFRPNDEVTRAEFATALSRMLYKTSDGEYKSTPKYYIHHMEKLVKEGIITNDNPNMKELRGYVMIMLMRSAK